jgi:fatty acid desaturase
MAAAVILKGIWLGSKRRRETSNKRPGLWKAKRDEAKVKAVAAVFLILLLVVGAAAAWLWFGLAQPYRGFPAEGVFVNLPHGASSRAVAHLLKQNA